MQKTAAHIAWKVLLKVAEVDPTLATHVKRVASRMGYGIPSAADLDDIFPPGWEKKSPSWQVQLENSEWLKIQNMKKQQGAAAAAGAASRGRSSSRGSSYAHSEGPAQHAYQSYYRTTRGPIGPESWVSRAAKGSMRHPFLTYMAASIPSAILRRAGEDVYALQRKRKYVTKEEKEHVMSPLKKGLRIGMGVGALLGALTPFAANTPLLRQYGLKNVLKQSAGPLLASSAIAALPGLAFGSGVGGLAALPIAKRRLFEVKEKMKERKKQEAA